SSENLALVGGLAGVSEFRDKHGGNSEGSFVARTPLATLGRHERRCFSASFLPKIWLWWAGLQGFQSYATSTAATRRGSFVARTPLATLGSHERCCFSASFLPKICV
ncbi:hypothetical protein, partial [Treponema zioleckii]|uniref:hypothetical protein n=1 Tax=Treponema zioleckii TaxID=331680 RepID=UPI001A910B4E